jgi:lipopolysaccharide/colanic/teichoic acid biosynthesis glycosyltransferase
MIYDVVKRAIDIIGSIILIIVFSPLMIVVAMIIKLTSPGPALVEKSNKHLMRMGKDGKIFRLLKFRSMVVGADILEENHPKYRKVYLEKREGGNWKPKNDSRITPVGRFIRKYSIDEMPQFFNVLKGDMSLVGPRPYLPNELEEQMKRFPGTEKYVKEMITVKPGITGYWQVMGRSNVRFDRRIAMDAYYAKKRSLIFDILIMLKTPWAVITAKGAS